MARISKCKCVYCKKEGLNTEFTPVEMKNGMKSYVCCDECYELLNQNRKFYECKYFIASCMKRLNKATDTFWTKWLNGHDAVEIEYLEYVLETQWRSISSWMEYKEFCNPMVKSKYLMAILEDKLDKEKTQREMIEQRYAIKQNESEMEDRVKTVVKKRRDISRFLD